MSWSFFQDENNVIVRDVQNYLYHQLNHESLKLLNFLTELMSRSQLKLLPFRSFEPVKKHESLFMSEYEINEKRKTRRQVVKCAACLNLRALHDLLHVTEGEWNRGRLPVRLIDVKKEVLKYISDEMKDLERASFWKSLGETQRSVDHRRYLSFPSKHEKLPRMDLGPIPYHHCYREAGKVSRNNLAAKGGGSLKELFTQFEKKKDR